MIAHIGELGSGARDSDRKGREAVASRGGDTLEGHTFSSIQFQKEQASERAGRQAGMPKSKSCHCLVSSLRPSVSQMDGRKDGIAWRNFAFASARMSPSLSSTWESPVGGERKLAEIKT